MNNTDTARRIPHAILLLASGLMALAAGCATDPAEQADSRLIRTLASVYHLHPAFAPRYRTARSHPAGRFIPQSIFSSPADVDLTDVDTRFSLLPPAAPESPNVAPRSRIVLSLAITDVSDNRSLAPNEPTASATVDDSIEIITASILPATANIRDDRALTAAVATANITFADAAGADSPGIELDIAGDTSDAPTDAHADVASDGNDEFIMLLGIHCSL